MCDFCNSEKLEYFNVQDMSKNKQCPITVDECEITIEYEESFGYERMHFYTSFEINYCPNCWRQLKNID